LKLSNTPIGDDGIAALVDSPRLHQIRELEVNACLIGDAGIERLAESRFVERLVRLGVCDNSFGPNGALRFARRIGQFTSLRALGLSGNSLEGAGFAALIQNQSPSLWFVWASGCHIGNGINEGIQSLEHNNLVFLDLSNNNLTPHSLKVLGNAAWARRLGGLRVNWNWCGDQGIRSLLSAGALDGLGCLDFVGCHCTNDLARDHGIVARLNQLALVISDVTGLRESLTRRYPFVGPQYSCIADKLSD
jgi:hypothetical protein